jgi:hypothetical protein
MAMPHMGRSHSTVAKVGLASPATARIVLVTEARDRPGHGTEPALHSAERFRRHLLAKNVHIPVWNGRSTSPAPAAGQDRIMKHPTTTALFSYWDQVRDGRLAPKRLEIEPMQLTPILSETFILERRSTVDYPYRLAGTRICDVFGHEFRGRNFLEGWTESDRISLSRQLAVVCQDGAGLVFEMAASGNERHTVIMEGVILPLMHTGNTITRLLGSISTLDSPEWLCAEPLRAIELLNHKLIWPGRTFDTNATPMRPITPALTPLAGARLVKIDRRSFRVLDGGLTPGTSIDTK